MLTYAELITLSQQLRDERVLTVYLDGSGADPASRRGWRVQLDHSLKEIRRRLEGAPHDERMQFARSVDVLNEQLTGFPAALGAPWWVAFITERGVVRAERLPAPTPTLAAWSSGICMAPYLRALKQTRRVVVAVADARKARLFTYEAGALAPADTIYAHVAIEAPARMGDPPRLGFHSGTRGTTGRDAAHRALQHGVSRMVKEVAERCSELSGRDGWIVVGGIPEVCVELVREAERLVPDRVWYYESLDVHATDAVVLRAAQQGASQLRDESDMRRVRKIVGGANVNGTVARGAVATREALEQRRVRELYLTPLYVEHHLEEAEAVVRASIDQGAVIEVLSDAAAQRLDDVGGLGARLRYPLPSGRGESAVTSTEEHEGQGVASPATGAAR